MAKHDDNINEIDDELDGLDVGDTIEPSEPSSDEADVEAVEAGLADVTPAEDSADAIEAKRPSRIRVAVEQEFDPASLVSSWALYHSPATEDTYSKTEQALVVAEAQPGVYLIQTFDVVDDSPIEQRIIELATFAKPDDEGGRWTFYDDRASIRKAIRGLGR